MGQAEREALATLFVEDVAFKTAMVGATSVEDALRIAGEHGIPATADDFAWPDGAELTDEQLQVATGGQDLDLTGQCIVYMYGYLVYTRPGG